MSQMVELWTENQTNVIQVINTSSQTKEIKQIIRNYIVNMI